MANIPKMFLIEQRRSSQLAYKQGSEKQRSQTDNGNMIIAACKHVSKNATYMGVLTGNMVTDSR